MSRALSDTKPVSASEFAAYMAAVDAPDHVAVAFSGGPDSLALLWLAAQWAKRSSRRRVVALSVDHGLRSDSAREAKAAANMAASIGVPHQIIKWGGTKPQSDIQAVAREARYALLAMHCVKLKCSALLVAHHQEDQAETFLLRLARGSGVDGLAGMAASRALSNDLRLLRPLLGTPKARVNAVLAKAKLSPLIDPSNENQRFTRVRMRQAMPELAALGLDAARLAETASHMARVRLALEAETDHWLGAHMHLDETGSVMVMLEPLLNLSAELALRALARMVRLVTGNAYNPRFGQLEAAYGSLQKGQIGAGRTFAGVKISREGKSVVLLREASAAARLSPVVVGSTRPLIWDDRFIVRLSRAPEGVSGGGYAVAALGAEKARSLVREGFRPPHGPKAALASLPALWQGEELVAAPHFGMAMTGIRCHASFLDPKNRNY